MTQHLPPDLGERLLAFSTARNWAACLAEIENFLATQGEAAPREILTYELRALIALGGRPIRALQAARRAMSSHPDDRQLLTLSALILRQVGRPRDAFKALNHVRRLDRDLKKAVAEGLFEILVETQHLDVARRTFDYATSRGLAEGFSQIHLSEFALLTSDIVLGRRIMEKAPEKLRRSPLYERICALVRRAGALTRQVDDASPHHLALCGAGHINPARLGILLEAARGAAFVGQPSRLYEIGGATEADRAISILDRSVREEDWAIACDACGPACQVLSAEFRRDLAVMHEGRYRLIAERLAVETLITAEVGFSDYSHEYPGARLDLVVVFRSPRREVCVALERRAAAGFALDAPDTEAFVLGLLERWTDNYRELLFNRRLVGRRIVLDWDEFYRSETSHANALADFLGLAPGDGTAHPGTCHHSIGNMLSYAASTGLAEDGTVLPAQFEEVVEAHAEAGFVATLLKRAYRRQFVGPGAASSTDPRSIAANATLQTSSKLATILNDCAAFSDGNTLQADEKACIERSLETKGVRQLPFPFASATAIVSDIDGSRRARYDAYVGQLVGELGLDFGDSTWLQWRNVADDYEGFVQAEFGFFSDSFSWWQDEPADYYEGTRTFAENLREFHRGNVDHFHSFLPRGPRVIVVPDHTIEGSFATAALGRAFQDERWGCQDTRVFAVQLCARDGRSCEGVRVLLTCEEGTICLHPGGEHAGTFVLTGTDRSPLVSGITSLRIEFSSPGTAKNLQRILLLGPPGDLILERLNVLRDEYNVETPLVTDHSGYHFRNAEGASRSNEAMERVLGDIGGGTTAALYGTHVSVDGKVLFSTEADHPKSVCRLLPELSSELEYQFVNPDGSTATSAGGLHLLDALTPAATRAGTGIYVALRTLPNVTEPKDGAEFDRTFSYQETFAPRMAAAMRAMSEKPGNLWPIYTHLGSFTKPGGRLPSPYFYEPTMHQLQDRVFNITGAAKAQDRLWFTRASVLYDYALMLRSIADHIERPDKNSIHIRSWRDDILDMELPRSPGQLYGLTFYVDDLDKATVCLDGAPLPALFRNPPDETGRCSVTIAESELHTTILGEVDPLSELDARRILQNCTWHWNDTDRCFGRFVCTRGLARLQVPTFAMTADGAQALQFAIRRDPGARFGVVLETVSGGRFFFGDTTLLGELGMDVTASYGFIGPGGDAGTWQLLTAPFHDLLWSDGSAPGGPMPNHDLSSYIIVCSAPDGQGVDLGHLRYVRPRANRARNHSPKGYCIVGNVPGFEPNQGVHLRSVDRPKRVKTTVRVDQRGYFCFSGIAPGRYHIWTHNDPILVDRRGAVVGIDGDTVNLILDRVGAPR